jgi:hypothetical protein
VRLEKTQSFADVYNRIVFVGTMFLAVSLGFQTHLVQLAVGQDDSTPSPQKPVIEPASDEGETAIAQFKYPKNLTCELFAAEPDVRL